jgi:hypothetical protein
MWLHPRPETFPDDFFGEPTGRSAATRPTRSAGRTSSVLNATLEDVPACSLVVGACHRLAPGCRVVVGVDATVAMGPSGGCAVTVPDARKARSAANGGGMAGPCSAPRWVSRRCWLMSPARWSSGVNEVVAVRGEGGVGVLATEVAPGDEPVAGGGVECVSIGGVGCEVAWVEVEPLGDLVAAGPGRVVDGDEDGPYRGQVAGVVGRMRKAAARSRCRGRKMGPPMSQQPNAARTVARSATTMTMRRLSSRSSRD